MARFFICPGAQKSATTWLYDNLKAHPDFWMPPLKELDYLGDAPTVRQMQLDRYEREKETMHPEVRAWWDFFATNRSLDKYPQIMRSDKITGDISPNYTYIPDAAINAKKIVPSALIIIILRHPVDRAWSHARMVAKNRGIDLSDMNWLMEFAQSQEVNSLGNYKKLVSDWQSNFGDAVYIYRYENIVADPVTGLNQILSLFDATPIDENFPPLLRVSNQGAEAAIPDRSLLEEHHREMVDYYESLFESDQRRSGPLGIGIQALLKKIRDLRS